MRRYNDYELIYLVQSEKCECALNVMIDKYTNMIYKYIHMYYLKETDFDDYYQEGLMLMFKTIDSFDDSYNKTFTRYFELCVKRRLSYLKSREPKYELHTDFEMYKDLNPLIEDFKVEGLTTLEENVFRRYYVENQKISFIALNETKTVKQIYNAIHRIKTKYQDNML